MIRYWIIKIAAEILGEGRFILPRSNCGLCSSGIKIINDKGTIYHVKASSDGKPFAYQLCADADTASKFCEWWEESPKIEGASCA